MKNIRIVARQISHLKYPKDKIKRLNWSDSFFGSALA
jgi:hypothetical protein